VTVRRLVGAHQREPPRLSGLCTANACAAFEYQASDLNEAGAFGFLIVLRIRFGAGRFLARFTRSPLLMFARWHVSWETGGGKVRRLTA
jgi:hypothetical protein